MNVHNRQKQSIAFLTTCWMVSSTIAGCNNSNAPSRTGATTPTPATTIASSPTPAAIPPAPGMSGVKPWATILKGESADELTFTTDGKLLYDDKVLLTKIPVSATSDGDITYAQRLLVSDRSPSGKFNVVRACESTTNETGACWAVFLVNHQTKNADKISIAKYGGQEWVKWSTDERYAMFAESMESVTWFVALDLQTRESRMFEYTSATADLSSFKWLDDRTFQANVMCGDRPDCKKSPFRGNITTLFAQE